MSRNSPSPTTQLAASDSQPDQQRFLTMAMAAGAGFFPPPPSLPMGPHPGFPRPYNYNFPPRAGGFMSPPLGGSASPRMSMLDSSFVTSTPKSSSMPLSTPPGSVGMIKTEPGTSSSLSSSGSGYLGQDESSPETKVGQASSTTNPSTLGRRRQMVSSSDSSTPTSTMTRTHQYKKIMKPLLERKRRARINKCLDELKEIMTAALTSQGENVSKLEKADILELTVRHLNKMQQARRIMVSSSRNPLEEIHRFQAGFSSCAQEAATFLMSTPGVDVHCCQRLLAHLSNVSTSNPLLMATPPPRPGFSPSSVSPQSGVTIPLPASSNRRRSSSASSSVMSSSAELSSPSTGPSLLPVPSSSVSSPKASPLAQDTTLTVAITTKSTDPEDEDQDEEREPQQRLQMPVKPEAIRPNTSDPVWRPF